jgi:hypothetical protein
MKSQFQSLGLKVSITKSLAHQASQGNALRDVERFRKLRSIVNQFDPVQLLSFGAPEDEYEPEVRTILERLHAELSEEEVLDIVYVEFLKWFGSESVVGQKSDYQLMSGVIFKVLVTPL